ncbi:MAG: NAD(+) synthase [Oscillospiraceae bacterium]|nr:NAD(+) synthase [Oscillospiraceae bacterium]
MKDYKTEFKTRVNFIRTTVQNANAAGVIFGNSGGKDSALVAILCKAACENTVGVIMPCGSARNYGEDKSDAEALAGQFGIETRVVDLSDTREKLLAELQKNSPEITAAAISNIAPRLRMTALYTIAASENRLVAGTGNRSEIYMGYFTKWGDGACDFNPIADLCATEVAEFLRYLNAPENIYKKPPSAGLFEGQTDESEMGISYKKIDEYLLHGVASEEDRAVIEGYHARTAHKRN